MKYEYFNPNPKVRYRKDGTPMGHHKGDCTTRALCKALDLSWKEAFKLQCEKGMELCDETDASEVTEKILLENGFKKGKINMDVVRKTHRRPTVRMLANEIGSSTTDEFGDANVVYSCTHHLVAGKADTIYDVFDSGDEVVWSFWYK